MTVEEAYLLASYLKSLSPKAALALGPVQYVGEDDKYPKDVHGQPMEPVKFTIRAEKCPNRRGVEMVLQHFAGSVTPMGDVLGRAAAGDFAALYLVGGDPQGWINDAAGGGARKVGHGHRARYFAVGGQPSGRRSCLPGGSFAERDGTFVNHAGLAQEIHRVDSLARRSEAGRPHSVGTRRAARVVQRRGVAEGNGGEDCRVRSAVESGDGRVRRAVEVRRTDVRLSTAVR